MIQASLDMLFLSLLCQGASHSLRSLFPGLQAESISRGDSPAEKETKSERTKSTEKDSFQGLGDSEGTICHVVTYSQALRSLSSKPYWAGSKGWTKIRRCLTPRLMPAVFLPDPKRPFPEDLCCRGTGHPTPSCCHTG